MPMYPSRLRKDPATKAAALTASVLPAFEAVVSTLNEAARLHQVAAESSLQEARDLREASLAAEALAFQQHDAAVRASQRAQAFGLLVDPDLT